MGLRDRLRRLVRQRMREAGRTFEESRRAYREGQTAPMTDHADLPTDDRGNARIVCRRYAERRAVPIDTEGRPSCFNPEHADCVGCAEDVREGVVETWSPPRD